MKILLTLALLILHTPFTFSQEPFIHESELILDGEDIELSFHNQKQRFSFNNELSSQKTPPNYRSYSDKSSFDEHNVHLYIRSISRILERLQSLGHFENLQLSIEPSELSDTEKMMFKEEVAALSSILAQLFDDRLSQQIEFNYLIFEEIDAHSLLLQNLRTAPLLESWQPSRNIDYFRSNAFERTINFCDQSVLSNFDDISRLQHRFTKFVTSTTLIKNALGNASSNSLGVLDRQMVSVILAISDLTERSKSWIQSCASNDFFYKRLEKIDESQKRLQQLLYAICLANRECEIPLSDK